MKLNCLISLILFVSIVFAQESIQVVQGLVERTIGKKYLSQFKFEEIPQENGMDVFEISQSGQNGSPILLKGSNALSMGTAFHNYLKYYTNSSITWGVDGTGNNINLPDILPAVPKTWHNVFSVKYRYYLNVCTISYTSAFWDWSRWEREIDWMALNGMNMPLTFIGQEYIWLKRMGNIQRWMGPLPLSWVNQQWELNKKIVKRQTEYGMFQVYPAFAGFVPEAIKILYPNSTTTTAREWNAFKSPIGESVVLDPQDPLFNVIGKAFIETINKELGVTSHLYNADQFNEMDISFIYIYIAIETMIAADPDAIWVMQGWQFLSGFWTDEHLSMYIYIFLNIYFIWCLFHNNGDERGIYGNLDRVGHGVIEDKHIYTDNMVGIGMTPEALEHNPVIFDMMAEMGWRHEKVAVNQWIESYIIRRYGQENIEAKEAWKHLLHNIYIHEEPDTELYSKPSLSLTYDANSLTFNDYSHGYTVLTKIPHFNMRIRTEKNSTAMFYSFEHILNSINGFKTTTKPFLYDLVDMSRQTLEFLFMDLYLYFVYTAKSVIYTNEFERYNKSDVSKNDLKRIGDCGKGYPSPCNVTYLMEACAQLPTCGGFNTNGYLKSKNTPLHTDTSDFYSRKTVPASIHINTLESIKSEMLSIIKDYDDLLATNPNFLLGRWIHAAKSFGATDEEKQFMERNAKNQISLWGPEGNIVDYASRAWSGMARTYYYDRWVVFLDTVISLAVKGEPYNMTQYDKKAIEIGKQWYMDNTNYTTVPHGDSIKIANQIHNKYLSTFLDSYNLSKDSTMNISPLYVSFSIHPKVMAYLCFIDPHCIAFDTNGNFFAKGGVYIQKEGVDIYTNTQKASRN
ncbi:hypothetical protein WA158_000935 [Blastocystis sp. Blastoise]